MKSDKTSTEHIANAIQLMDTELFHLILKT